MIFDHSRAELSFPARTCMARRCHMPGMQEARRNKIGMEEDLPAFHLHGGARGRHAGRFLHAILTCRDTPLASLGCLNFVHDLDMSHPSFSFSHEIPVFPPCLRLGFIFGDKSDNLPRFSTASPPSQTTSQSGDFSASMCLPGPIFPVYFVRIWVMSRASECPGVAIALRQP
jgi:hypothetical protein